MPQYEYAGDIYEQDELLKAAENDGVSLDEYMETHSIKMTEDSLKEVKQDKLNKDVYKKVMSMMPGNIMPDWLQDVFGVTAAPFVSGTASIASGLAKSAEVGIEGAMGYTKQEMIDDGDNFLSRYLDTTAENLDMFGVSYTDEQGGEMTFKELIDKGEYAKATARASQDALKSAPSLLAYRFPVVGQAVLGLSTFGNTFKEDLVNRTDATLKQVTGNAAWAGGSEFLGELIGGKIFRGLGIIGGVAGKGFMVDQVKQYSQGVIVKTLAGLLGEGFTEALTAVSTLKGENINYGDEQSLQDYVDAVVNAAAPAMLLGGSTGAISGVGKKDKKELYKLAASEQWQQDQLARGKQIYETHVDMAAAEEGNKQWFADKIKDLQDQNTKAEEELFGSFENLSETETERYAGNLDGIAELRNIVGNKKYSEDSKEQAAAQIREALEDNNRMLNDPNFDLEVEVTIGEIFKDSERINKQVKKAKGINRDDLTIKILKNDAEVEAASLINPEAKTSDGMFLAKDKDGKAVIYINQARAAQTGQTNVLGHELLHYVVSRAFKTDNQSMTPLVDSFKSFLNETPENKAILQTIEKRIQSKYANKDGTLKDGAVEEYMNIFSDLISKKKIKNNEDASSIITSKYKEVLMGLGFAKVELNSGQDVFNFIRNYNKNINRKGLLGKLTMKGALNTEITSNIKGVEAADNTSAVDKKSMSEASDKVTEIYENQGAAGAFDIIAQFKPIVNKLVEKRREAPNFDKQLLTDEIETGKRGILDLISEYKPESGVPLAAFINKYLPARAIEASEDITNAQERAKKEKAEEKPSLRKKLKIETGSDVYSKVKNAVIKTFGTKLPNVDTNKLKSALQKAFRTELKKPIAKFIGTRAKYEQFIKEYGREVYNKLDQSTINKRFKQFSEPVLNKDGKQEREKTPQGNAIFKKKKFNQGEWNSYFLSKSVGASTRGTRKDALAESIGEELGFDATMEVLKTPEVSERRKDILSLFGQEQLENEVQVIAKEIDRNPDMKFSKGDLKLEGVYMTGLEFAQQAESLIVRINNNEQVFDEKGKIIVKYNGQNYSGNVVEVIYDAYHNGRVGFGKDRGLSVLTKISKYVLGDANVGTTYEYMTWDKINAFGKKNSRVQNDDQTFAGPGEGKIYIAPIGTFPGGFVAAPDLVLMIDKYTAAETQIPIELKAAAARLGKNSPDFVSWSEGTFKREKRKLNRKGQAEKTGFTQEQLDKMESKVMEAINNVIKEAGPLLKALKEKMPGLTDITSTTKIPRLEVWDTVTGLGSVRALTNNSTVMVNGDFIANHYNSKGVYYIHILDKGTFYLGSDPLGIAKELGITKLEGDFPLKARINAVSDKNGNITMKITAEPELQLGYVTSKSTFDITSNEGLNKLLQTKKFIAQQKLAKIIKPEVKKIEVLKKAFKESRSIDPEVKGITILDFDDTLATSKSLINFTRTDGSKGTLTPEQYASTYEDLQDLGYTFDFSEFSKVVKGKPAPLINKAKKLAKKFGTKNMFILTARPADANLAIFEFLKSQGLNIPLENITGLANSTSEAKALWIAGKVGEGYNDFYFADDALQNVQAVKNMLSQFDVKSKVQQARIKFSKDIDVKFNAILEDVTGIESKKRFDFIKARKRGSGKGKFRLFIPPSHEDFVGLLYNFMGKGEKGNQHRDFFEETLIRPLNRANKEYDTARQSIATDYKNLNKQFPDVKKMLSKKTPDGDFTYQDAIRVYLWDKNGYTIPGLSPVNQKSLVEIVNSNPELQTYADAINIISKQEKYVSPTDGWDSGDIRMDLDDATGRVGRAQFFKEFNENADVIFSKENLNKIEAAYGKGVREALEDMLYRIKTGRNKPTGQNGMVNTLMNWLNGSVGSVMFFNIRSSLLQQMSIVNYINFADNNVFAAAKAFANQKQYWSDWAFIFNSDMLKQRRGGIMTDVNGAELAADMRKSKNPHRFLISKLLEIGFLPTQIGDNIAIATGGAMYYRNRINTYLKEGLSKKEAETKAFTDFQNITQSTQQSARPDMVSQQQASVIGKVILNFQNVTSQFNRLGKKAFQDIYNRRITKPNTTQMQSDISNASRITYYFAVQNAIFYTLQTALFAMMFEDDEDDNNNLFLKKKERLINGSIDSVLRGTGMIGSVASTLKNVAIAWARQRDVNYNPDESAVLVEALNLSPVLGIKARKIVNAEKTLNYNKKVIDHMETFDIDNPQWSAYTNYVEGFTNAPLNRLYNKTQNVRQSLNNEHEAWERVSMGLGWSQYNLGLKNTEIEEVKRRIKAASRAKQKSKKKNKKFLF